MEWGIGVLDQVDSIRIDVDPKDSVTTAGKSNARCEPRWTEADDCDTGHAGLNQPRRINVPRSSSIRERVVCRLRADQCLVKQVWRFARARRGCRLRPRVVRQGARAARTSAGRLPP